MKKSLQILLEELDQKIRSPLSAIAVSLQLLETSQTAEKHKLIKEIIAVDEALRNLIDPYGDLLEEYPFLNDGC